MWCGLAAIARRSAAGGLLAWSGTPVAAADSPCATLGGDVEGEHTCHVQASTSNYTLDMRFPLDYADEQALIDYINQNRDGFVSVAQTSWHLVSLGECHLLLDL